MVEIREMRNFDVLNFNKDTGDISAINTEDKEGKESRKWSACSQDDYEETLKSFEYGCLMRRDSWHAQLGNPPSYGAVSERLQTLSEEMKILSKDLRDTINDISSNVKLLTQYIPAIVSNTLDELTLSDDENRYELLEKAEEAFNFKLTLKRHADGDASEVKKAKNQKLDIDK